MRSLVSPEIQARESHQAQAVAPDFRSALWIFGAWMIAVAGSMACGLREGVVDRARPGSDDDSARGIHDLTLQDFPQQHQLSVRAGDGFVPLGVDLSPGTPLRVEVRGRAGVSPWGNAQQRAGAEAPEPLRADGAVILRLGDQSIVAGTQSVLRVSERVRPEIAVNSSAYDANRIFDVRLGWGEPTRPYRAELSTLGLVPGQGERKEFMGARQGDRAGQASMVLNLAPGTRVWVQPEQEKSAEHRVGAQPLSGSQATPARSPRTAWMGTTPDGRARLFDGPTAMSVDEGGALTLRALTRSAPAGPLRVELFEPLGTRAELIPLQIMDEVEVVDLEVLPRRFIETPLEVQAGDLVRIEVRGENRLVSRAGSSAHNVGVHGGLREVPRALRNGDRAWLVPGGRERGVYLRVGDEVMELQGSDAFYAPQDGRLELGVNQCFDGGDWPAYVKCRERLKGWELNLKVAIGVSSGAP